LLVRNVVDADFEIRDFGIYRDYLIPSPRIIVSSLI
jgi:hypothetical protein